MSEGPLTSAEVRSAFARRVPKIAVSVAYRVRLLTVLAGLVLLQVLYVVVIIGTLTLATAVTIAILGSGMPLNFITFVIYVGPPAAGCIATLFLLKPILVRPPKADEPVRLDRDTELLLFEFVDRLCNTVGSPRPSRIYVDLKVNASAAVRGWRGLLFGDVVLTIGLPLATGLDLAQFTGVLAHEFGHFAQRTGLRSYFLIQSIQHWFARVVYERDSWDAWLDRHRNHRDWRFKAVANLSHAVVRLSRKYLEVLMKAGQFISSGFSRQMEFNADDYEAAVVGAQVFENTSNRLPVLSVGARLAWDDAAANWSVGRIPEDMAALITTRATLLPEETARSIVEYAAAAKTGRADTHPSTADRIANARAVAGEPIFTLDGHPSRLFADLRLLCIAATRHHFEKAVGVSAADKQVLSTDAAVAESIAASRAERSAVELFTAPAAFCCRWFRLPDENAADAGNDMEQDTSSIPMIDAAVYDSAVETNLLHFAALVIAQAGVKVGTSAFRLQASDLGSIRAQEKESRGKLLALHEAYRMMTAPATRAIRRLHLHLPEGSNVVASESDVEIANLRSAKLCYAALSAVQDDIFEIRCLMFAAANVRLNAKVFPAAVCANLLDDLRERAVSRMNRIIERLSDAPAIVSFNAQQPATLSLQLKPAGTTPQEGLQEFLSRSEILAARSLAQIAYFALLFRNAGPMTDDGNQPSVGSVAV